MTARPSMFEFAGGAVERLAGCGGEVFGGPPLLRVVGRAYMGTPPAVPGAFVLRVGSRRTGLSRRRPGS